MARQKQKNKKNTKRSLFCVLLLGFVLLIFFTVWLSYKKRKDAVRTNAEETIEQMKSICQRYDDYKVGITTTELQLLINEINILQNYVQDYVQDYAKDLDEALTLFAQEQYLSGIIVTDEHLNPVKNINLTKESNLELLDTICSGQQPQQIMEFPQKVYADSIELHEKEYEYAIAARKDEPGVLICYQDMTESHNDKYVISLGSMLDAGLYNEDEVMLVGDGRNILSSNLDGVTGMKVGEWPVSQVLFREMMPVDADLIKLYYDGDIWWGKYDQYREYYLYNFYKIKRLDPDMLRKLGMVTGIYLFFSMLLLLFLQKQEKEKMQQMEKEYYMLTAISSIYDAHILFHLNTNRWEAILETAGMKQHLTGIKDSDEMLQVFTKQLMMESAREKFLEFMDLNTMAERLSDKPFLGYNFEAVKGRWYQALLVPKNRDKEEQVTTVIMLIRNVTDQTRKELDYREQLRSSMEAAAEANAAKTDFLRRMSHDIRTPINGIRGMAEIGINSAQDADSVKNSFEKIHMASDFLLELVNNILDMSKIEAGEVKTEHLSFNLKELIQRIAALTASQAADSEIQLQCEPMEAEHWNLIGSPLNIQKVFQNIISNAIKYNRPGGFVRISCRETFCDGEKASFTFVCEDTGIGMSEEFQKHAYDLFAQEAKSARTSYSGSGLGLSIVKKTVELLDGEVSFVSEEGKGTTFTVKLTLQIDKDQKEQPEQRTDQKIRIEQIHVLLVEDNELNREIAACMLEEQGAEVTEAEDGQQALEQFQASEPGTFDIILMDIMMPVMDGMEAARAIRALDRPDAAQIPIIATSANAFQDDIEACRASGMNEHISKPLDFEKLFHLIHKYTE